MSASPSRRWSRPERRAAIPLQAASFDTWDRKYRLRDANGEPVDDSVDATLRRVARALADVETAPAMRERCHEEFLWALRQGALPAGRILANAGAEDHKPAASTINCTVSGTLGDSMESILGRLAEAGLTLKAGCGIGYDFSTLRPAGAHVRGAGAQSSGPLSFMEVFDRLCLTVMSAGGRRGAQMATFHVGHPDVMDFIRAKSENGRLRQFNLSLLVSDAFMAAVEADAPWPLAFPLRREEMPATSDEALDDASLVWRDWPVADGYVHDDSGRAACRVYATVPARQVWKAIMQSTYDYAEPGFILVDRYNELNNNWFCEDIRATNPCGEQGLPPYGSCLLGSVDLTRFVRDPFTPDAEFDWETFRRVVKAFTRMLDNVVEINGLALPEQDASIRATRRHGMGYLGLGSCLTMLRLRYGSAASVAFTEQVTRELAITGWRCALDLAREKSPAPLLQQDFTVTAPMLRRRPELAADGYREGDVLPGRVLHARYSRYMQRIAGIDPELVEALAAVGARFTHHTSIAPTGTIALSFANNASNGIEPSFAHTYSRNILREGRKSKERVDVVSAELLAYRELVDPSAGRAASAGGTALPEWFTTAAEVDPRHHVDVQAAAQKWVDSSISKTINVPADYPFDDFVDIYRYAYEQGLKGCTTFRFNPESFQGVLVRNEDLARSTYRFELEDGSVVEARGDDEIEYDGQVHTAANLFDALKEGYYGRY